MNPSTPPVPRLPSRSTPAAHDPTPAPSDATRRLVRSEQDAWRELKLQMEELHARLHYLKLMLKLGVSRR